MSETNSNYPVISQPKKSWVGIIGVITLVIFIFVGYNSEDLESTGLKALFIAFPIIIIVQSFMAFIRTYLLRITVNEANVTFSILNFTLKQFERRQITGWNEEQQKTDSDSDDIYFTTTFYTEAGDYFNLHSNRLENYEQLKHAISIGVIKTIQQPVSKLQISKVVKIVAAVAWFILVVYNWFWGMMVGVALAAFQIVAGVFVRPWR